MGAAESRSGPSGARTHSLIGPETWQAMRWRCSGDSFCGDCMPCIGTTARREVGRSFTKSSLVHVDFLARLRLNYTMGSRFRMEARSRSSSSNPIDTSRTEVVKLDTDRTPIILPDTFRLTQAPDGRHYQNVSRTPDSTPLTYWYQRFHFVDVLRSSQSAVLSSGAPRHFFSSYSA